MDAEFDPPNTWPEGYEPHEQSEACLEKRTEESAFTWQRDLEVLILTGTVWYPGCVREEDGFGGTISDCEANGRELDSYYYYFCDDSEWEYPDTGETIERQEPCVWWFKMVENGEECDTTLVCVPEDRLEEINWPSDVGFEHYETFGLSC